ncbi:MAG: peroxiredoxin [Pseudomonadota bacterium]
MEIGKKTPKFNSVNQSDVAVSSDDLTGKPFILFFYPRDNTSGCTKEAIGFTENTDAFAKLGITILGVSKDSVKSHVKFIEKQNLGMDLLSDENGTMCEDFGVWKEKSMYGKTYFGIERSTFVISKTGMLLAEWRKVKVPGHVDAVLEWAQNNADAL